jgi:hypothetical protein
MRLFLNLSAPSGCIAGIAGVRMGLVRLKNRAAPWSLITPKAEVAEVAQGEAILESA